MKQDPSIGAVNYTTMPDGYDAFSARVPEQVPSYPIPPVIPDAGTVKNLWINSFIRSVNWKPRNSGFYIDGKNGYAEFSNMYITGTATVVGKIQTAASGQRIVIDSSTQTFTMYDAYDTPFVIIGALPNSDSSEMSVAGDVFISADLINAQSSTASAGTFIRAYTDGFGISQARIEVMQSGNSNSVTELGNDGYVAHYGTNTDAVFDLDNNGTAAIAGALYIAGWDVTAPAAFYFPSPATNMAISPVPPAGAPTSRRIRVYIGSTLYNLTATLDTDLSIYETETITAGETKTVVRT